MREASTLATLGAVLCLCTSPAQAVGFGRVSNTTQLGQPLNFSAIVRLEPDETLSRECVSAEVQSGENMLLPGQVRATVEGAADSADRIVRVTTNAIIDEPVVTVSVTVGCDAKVTRKFVAFIDPPVVNLAQAPAPIASDTPSAQRNESPVSAVVDSARSLARPAPAPAAKRSTTAVARGRTRVRVATATRAVPQRSTEALVPRAAASNRSAGVGRQPAVARAEPSGSRLVIESATRVAAASASAPASGPMSAAAAAAAAASAAMTPPPPALAFDDQAAQLARERERVRLLEEGLAKLRSDSQATQSSLVALQAKLKQAESQRDAGWLVYALATLSGLLALIAAALVWRQWRARRLASWWNPPAAAPSEPPRPVVRAEPVVAETLETPATPRLASTKLLVARNAPTLAQDGRGAAQAQSAAVVEETPRELSVEELIDLEQQAEFFLVLGQDDAAIELLMSHVRSDGGISPLPYLKLLEIYRRQGDTAAYQRIRERFNLRFNAYAPDWDADLQHGRALVDYPDTLKRLQDFWPQPARVMEMLDASLFRRNSSDETFDLPAYRELLFLYSVARDLGEHGGSFETDGHVDLLLPLPDDTAPMPAPLPVSRYTPAAGSVAAQFGNSGMMTLPVDLDVSFEPVRAVAPEPIAVAFAPVTPYEPASSPEFGFLEFNLDDAPALPKTGSSGKA